MTLNASIDRAHCLPWGLEGGLEGSGNEVLMRKDGVWDKERRNAKVLTAPLKTGDAYALRSGGGGGFGSPLKRPPQSVREDVREGYVTLAAARDYYGVVLDPETLDIDATATLRQRADLAEVHHRRMANQTTPVRRLTAAELSQKAEDHPPVPCLQMSCCGRISFPFLDEDGKP
jgi:N-methylhydantoinase B/oxoprolinase/acetone carboxylase alpha subunit